VSENRKPDEVGNYMQINHFKVVEQHPVYPSERQSRSAYSGEEKTRKRSNENIGIDEKSGIDD
jgi:hypothetical protein